MQAKQNPVEVQLAQLATEHVRVGVGKVSFTHCAVESKTYPISQIKQILPVGLTVQFKHIGSMQV
jgi:hypothetical protein